MQTTRTCDKRATREYLQKKVYFITMFPDDIQQACRNVSSIMSTLPFRIPDEDVDAVLRPVSSTTCSPFSVGQWVRFRRGTYRGDIGLVCERCISSDLVVVYVVPRLNMTKASSKKKRSDGRPPPQLFDADEIRKVYGSDAVSSSGSLLVFDGQKFEEGFLRLAVLSSHFIVTASPSDSEKAVFISSRVVSPTDRALELGENVIVTRGQYVGLNAVVASISDTEKTATLHFLQDEQHIPRVACDIPFSEFHRYYPVGSNVRILDGPHANCQGMVLASNDNMLEILKRGSEECVSFVSFYSI